MHCITISSNSSGGGKTTVTLGLLKALKNRGYAVQSYKVGPDYIDPAFHAHITKTPSRNLDLYLMGEEGVKASFSRGKGDVGIIEGVMGLYDGKGITSEFSTAHAARVLDTPVILVISPKAQVATLCAELKGMLEFENIKIPGIIFNNISESYFRLLKLAVEKHCGIKVFGYLPKHEALKLKSRHLGLVQSSEIEDLDSKIQLCAELLEKHVDIDALMACFSESKIHEEAYEDTFHLKNKGLRIAVARDKAFSFYYRENLELLEEAGKVIYFSPLDDSALPEDVDFIYIGGGYPEVFREELSRNESMLSSIRQALDKGVRCYAECGGLMYLTEAIEGNEAVGFFMGSAFMTDKLQNFGYSRIAIKDENTMLPKGLQINCHEFHKSFVQLEEKTIYTVEKDMIDGSTKQWTCGYVQGNTLAGYAHVHFFGNMEMLKALLGWEIVSKFENE